MGLRQQPSKAQYETQNLHQQLKHDQAELAMQATEAAVLQAIDADTHNSYLNQGMGAMSAAVMSGIATPTP